MSVDRTELPPVGPDPLFTFPRPVKHTLANGLTIWAVEHGAMPVVSACLLLHCGSASDPENHGGLGSLTADLLDEGSGSRSALEVQEALRQIGARFNRHVTADATQLRMTSLSRFTGQALTLLAELGTCPTFDEEQFTRVKQLRLDQLVQLRDVPSANANRIMVEALYGGHPYGHNPSGTEASIQTLTRDHVVDFHREFYQPAKATLILVGAMPAEQLLDQAATAFEMWCATPETRTADLDTRCEAHSEGTQRERLIVMNRPGAAQSELRIGHRGVSRDTPDYHALRVLNAILGGQFVSRLNLNLREDKGYTYGVSTGFTFCRYAGDFMAALSVQTDATSESIREVLKEIRHIRDSHPVSDEELVQAKAALTRGYPRGFETASQVAQGFARSALYHLPDDYFTQVVPSVNLVDLETVRRVAQEYLAPDQVTTVVVGDRDAIATGLTDLDAGELTEIKLEDLISN